MPTILQEPIKLSSSNYWHELEAMFRSGKLPRELVDALKALVASHLGHGNPPTVSQLEVKQATEHLKCGVILSDSARDMYLDLAVFVPKNPATHRAFLVFIPKYQGGRLKTLDQLE
jgi:hypothetical protein